MALLTELGAALVASDDLRHEMHQKDKQQSGLPPGSTRELMPIGLHVTCPDFAYVRVHRRYGGMDDRVLSDKEIAEWSRRLVGWAPGVSGPVYVLWGTDMEDAPVVNARNLAAVRGRGACESAVTGKAACCVCMCVRYGWNKHGESQAVPEALRFDWPGWLRRQPPKRGTLQAFFGQTKRQKQDESEQ